MCTVKIENITVYNEKALAPINNIPFIVCFMLIFHYFP